MSNLVLNQSSWPTLARDLAILTVPDSPIDMKAVLTNYSMTKEELVDLFRNPSFVALFDKELEVCRKHGDKAAARYRASTLSQALAEKLFRDALADQLKPGEAIKLLDLLYEASGIMDKEPQVQVAVQNNTKIALPLPHIGKVNHCFDAESGNV